MLLLQLPTGKAVKVLLFRHHSKSQVQAPDTDTASPQAGSVIRTQYLMSLLCSASCRRRKAGSAGIIQSRLLVRASAGDSGEAQVQGATGKPVRQVTESAGNGGRQVRPPLQDQKLICPAKSSAFWIWEALC